MFERVTAFIPTGSKVVFRSGVGENRLHMQMKVWWREAMNQLVSETRSNGSQSQGRWKIEAKHGGAKRVVVGAMVRGTRCAPER